MWLLFLLMDDIELEGAGTVVLNWGAANSRGRPSLILPRLVCCRGKVFGGAYAIIRTCSPVEINGRVVECFAGRGLVMTGACWQAPLSTVLVIVVNGLIQSEPLAINAGRLVSVHDSTPASHHGLCLLQKAN